MIEIDRDFLRDGGREGVDEGEGEGVGEGEREREREREVRECDCIFVGLWRAESQSPPPSLQRTISQSEQATVATSSSQLSHNRFSLSLPLSLPPILSSSSPCSGMVAPILTLDEGVRGRAGEGDVEGEGEGAEEGEGEAKRERERGVRV